MDLITLLGLALIIGATTNIILNPNWRWTMISLAIQYLAVFFFVMQSWPVALAAVKLVAGWMAAALLAPSQIEDLQENEALSGTSGRIFRLISSGFIILMAFFIAPSAGAWLPVDENILRAGLMMIGMGLFQLGITQKPMRVVVGLLTVLSGFEIIYSSLESSTLVAGLLAVLTLGLALAGVYLTPTPVEEVNE